MHAFFKSNFGNLIKFIYFLWYLGCLERALSYARHSLYNECDSQCRTGGLVHLTVASVYLEMGGFKRCLEGLQGAHKIATGELQEI